MAHMIEMLGGKAQMAWAGETPWHGLGTQVPADLTPQQMLQAAGLDWRVNKIPAYAEIGGEKVDIGRSALVRDFDNKILDVITDDWQPNQNADAFEFFNDFVGNGDMEMHTAGSLRGGKIVWGLAKVNESFELFKGDKVDSYLLFTNPHSYGQSIDIRFTPIRVVCNNTLTLSLSKNANQMVKVSHRNEFDGDKVKEMLGVASDKLASYKEMAQYLGSKRYNEESVVDYFKRIFPMNSTKGKEISKNAKIALEVIDQQPGANFAEGTWWSAFNTVTFMTDHVIGRTVDARLDSAWFGANKSLKTKALETAIEMAEVA
jgi:phage/plasmid-like protein (TIGR03299 family)